VQQPRRQCSSIYIHCFKRENSISEAFEQVKQEAVRLHHKLKEAEERKASLLEEERTRSTPAQEREQLLQRVKDDNAEIATMERQVAEIRDQTHKKQQELEQTEQVQLEQLLDTVATHFTVCLVFMWL
jgi:intraflagellar transport protein 74